jgi:hypothetical protein
MNQIFAKTLIIGSLCWALSPAYAGPLAPGGSVSPVTLLPGTATFPVGTPNGVSTFGYKPFLQEDGSWSAPTGGVPNNGIDFDSATFYDPVTHDLDFFYQVQNLAKNVPTVGDNTVVTTYKLNLPTLTTGVTIMGVDQINNMNFSAAANADNFLDPTLGINISSVSLALNDMTLTVQMSGSGIGPGQNSAVLVLQTNANDFVQSGMGVFNWKSNPPAGSFGSINPNFVLNTLEPILSTPEPGFYGVLSLGLAGLLLLAHRRSNKTKSNNESAGA